MMTLPQFARRKFIQNDDRIDRVVLDAILYAMAKALDHMGAQGQLLLDRMGQELVNYLVEKDYVKKLDEPFQMVSQIERFFLERGLADDLQVKVEGDYAVVHWKNFKALEAMTSLQDKMCPLVSCPTCIASDALLKAAGFAFGPWEDLRVVGPGRRDITYKRRMTRVGKL